MKVVGARAGEHLHLSVAAAHFGVNRGQYQTHFTDEIGTHEGGRTHSGLHVSSGAARFHAVSGDVHAAHAQPCERASDPVVVHTRSRQSVEQTQHVVTDDR